MKGKNNKNTIWPKTKHYYDLFILAQSRKHATIIFYSMETLNVF